MPRLYERPPVREAVCEFHFVKRDPDPTASGVLKAEVSQEYDGIPSTDQTFQVGSGGEPAAYLNIRAPETAVRLPSQDRRKMLTLMPSLFAVHRLPPYEGWTEQFFPQIQWAWEKFQRAFPHPRPISKVVLRYLNTVKVAQEDLGIRLDAYFSNVGGLPGELVDSAGVSSLACRYETTNLTPEEDYVTVFSVGFATPNSALGIKEGSYLLDIDVQRSWPSGFSDSPLDHLDDLKQRERTVFEATITDKTRKLFQ